MAVAEGFETSVVSWSSDHTRAEVRIFLTGDHGIYVQLRVSCGQIVGTREAS